MKNKSELLKLIAIISMIIDHVGFVFFPDNDVFRMIGRLAFPIFAYQITVGYRYTSNIHRYLLRILLFALLSIVPFGLVFGFGKLNVLFTFSLGLFIIYLVDKKRLYFGWGLVLVPIFITMDYGLYGVLLIIIFHFIKQNTLKLIIMTSLTVLYVSLLNWSPQMYALLGVLLALINWKPKLNFRLNKYIFYWFYPVHLVVIYLIQLCI